MCWNLDETSGGHVATVMAECLDAAMADRFREGLIAVLRESGALAVDLSRVRFIDTAGLGALCALTRAGRGKVRLVGVSPRLARGLERAPSLAPACRSPAGADSSSA